MSTTSAWNDLVTWCRTNAPRTAEAIEPGAASTDLDRASVASGHEWPEELRSFYRLQNGTREDSFALDGLLFGFTPLSLSELLDETRARNEMIAYFDADDLADCLGDEAGSGSPFWLPPLVPFARHVSGNPLCIDTRPGTEHGCIVDVDDDGFEDAAWLSLDQLLDAVLASLQSGQPHDELRPSVDDGELTWIFTGVMSADQRPTVRRPAERP